MGALLGKRGLKEGDGFSSWQGGKGARFRRACFGWKGEGDWEGLGAMALGWGRAHWCLAKAGRWGLEEEGLGLNGLSVCSWLLPLFHSLAPVGSELATDCWLLLPFYSFSTVRIRLAVGSWLLHPAVEHEVYLQGTHLVLATVGIVNFGALSCDLQLGRRRVDLATLSV